MTKDSIYSANDTIEKSKGSMLLHSKIGSKDGENTKETIINIKSQKSQKSNKESE